MFLLASRLVLRADHVGPVGDLGEHVGQVPDSEPVKAEVPDLGLEVIADVRLIPAVRRRPRLLARHPPVEPVTDGGLPVERHPDSELPGHVGRIRQRLAAAAEFVEEVTDAADCVFVVPGEVEDRAHLVQVALRVLDGRVAGAAEDPARPVLAWRYLLL